MIRSAVARLVATGNVPYGCQAEQCLDVRVVRLRLERSPEEDLGVDRAVSDLGADLLVAAHGSAQVAGHGQAQLVFEHCAGRPGRVEAVRAQRQRLSSVQASSSSFLLSCLLSRAIMAIWRF